MAQPSAGQAVGLKACPEDFICSISFDMMSNPVCLKQTGKVYDHSSFHEWLTTGGSICPLTGIQLQNPIVLEPDHALRARIWAFRASMQQQDTGCYCPSGPDLQVDMPMFRSKSVEQQEQELQRLLAARHISAPPAETLTMYNRLASAVAWLRRGIVLKQVMQKKPPSTYYVTTSGTHIYRRGDL